MGMCMYACSHIRRPDPSLVNVSHENSKAAAAVCVHLSLHISMHMYAFAHVFWSVSLITTRRHLLRCACIFPRMRSASRGLNMCIDTCNDMCMSMSACTRCIEYGNGHGRTHVWAYAHAHMSVHMSIHTCLCTPKWADGLHDDT